MRTFKSAITTGLLAFFFATNAQALILNAAQPIDRIVTVQMIQTDNEAGMFATLFGNGSQQAEIFGFIDEIWAQAGIDVNFLAPTSYSNEFAYQGTTGMNSPRSTDDLATIETNGGHGMGGAGVSNPNPLVLDMYFVDIVPGFSMLSENSANGLAFRPGKTSAVSVGMNLLTFEEGREVIASVIAHEIGHNLGLPHLGELENLMCGGGSPCPPDGLGMGGTLDGERLNAAQITSARGSQYAVVVPIPAALWMFASGLLALTGRRLSRA